jgi:predicted transcriptional regulator
MARCLKRSVAVLLFFSLVSVLIVSGNTGGYDVVPVSPDTLSGTPHDPVPVSFWELSPRVMAIGIVLSFFPLLLFPIELIYLLKIFAWLGYRRVSCDPVFQNKNRVRIYTVIREHPVINFPALSRITKIKRTTIRYHLVILSHHGKITGLHSLNTTCYFENNGQFSGFEKQMICQLENGIARNIVEILVTSPGISRRNLVEKIGIAGSSVTWYTNHLSRGGIITVTKKGRDACYTLTKEAKEFFRTVYRNYSGVVPGRRGTAGAGH